MRYTKSALLVFGLGLVVGFGLIVAEMPKLALVASGLMAVGLVGLPVAIAADGHRAQASQRRQALLSPTAAAAERTGCAEEL